MRKIHKHIIHCSDSTFGDVSVIRTWHLNRGWRDVGYHFIIRRDGEIEVGRMLHEVGAHCKGQNSMSIGTCLIGKADFTDAQMQKLKKLHQALKKLFPTLHAYGHRDFTKSKTCPNFEVKSFLA